MCTARVVVVVVVAVAAVVFVDKVDSAVYFSTGD